MRKFTLLLVSIMTMLFTVGCEEKQRAAVEPGGAQVRDIAGQEGKSATVELSDEQAENIVRRSYQYVAMFNVIQKHVFDPVSGAMCWS